MRVVIADDSVLLREGAARLLADAGIEVVGQAGDGEELLEAVRRLRPDVAVTDIRMPPTHTDEGLRAARTIRAELPGTGVLVLSQYLEEPYAFELLGDNAEGVGYLLKDRVGDPRGFADAVRQVAAGGSALDPAVVAQMLGRRRVRDPLQELSDRERDVLARMAEGQSNAAIAQGLDLSDRAVERHVSAIFTKLDLPAGNEGHRRVLAVLRYLRGA
jgi:DNA-binding NarL/FixJ family response regulator